jgi:ligand-binding SRPBCC domain-containing protein
VLERVQRLPVPPEDAFAFFADPGNLEAITPDWLRFRIVAAPATLDRGARIRYRLRLFGVPISWLTEIVAWEPPHGFTDVQLRGPFSLWEHRHELSPAGSDATEMRDRVRYALPLGILGEAARALLVDRWLERIFDYRADTIRQLV